MPAKRAVDLTGSLILLLLLSPVLLAVTAAVALTSPGPVLTRQDRAGLGGRTFAMLTFRTRRAGTRCSTPVGRALRDHFLDELPQLINVARGEMSLVGPRPLPPENSGPATGAGRARLGVRPGITGLWQISGRSELPGGDGRARSALHGGVLAGTGPADPGPDPPGRFHRARSGPSSPGPPGQACLSDTDHRVRGYSAAQ